MQAIRIHQFGGPEVLRLEDVPVPEPGPGEALIKVEATGINYVDVYHRTGLYPGQLPLTLGREAAGTVERIGVGVTTCRPGDRVVSEAVRGGYAQYALAAARRIGSRRATPAWSMPRPGVRVSCSARSPAGSAPG